MKFLKFLEKKFFEIFEKKNFFEIFEQKIFLKFLGFWAFKQKDYNSLYGLLWLFELLGFLTIIVYELENLKDLYKKRA